MTHLWLCIFVSPCIAMLTDIDLGKILTSNLDFLVVLHLIPTRFNCRNECYIVNFHIS